MGLFVTSYSAALLHGAYAILRTPTPVISGAGTATACIVDQFPWGPAQQIVEPSGVADMINTMAPFGSSHTGAGYLAITNKAFPELFLVRVTGTAAAIATVVLQSSVPATVITLSLLYVGAMGNSVTATVAPATDGNADHFDLIVSITGASGTTSDILRSLNYSGVGANSAPNLESATLLGSITFGAAGVPVAGTYTFSGGSDGTAISTDWLGTLGTGNRGLAITEGNRDIDHIFYGDPGNSLRTALNTGMQAHVEELSNRMGYINGPSGQTAAAAQADAASYPSKFIQYIDVWPYVNNEAGQRTLVAPASFAASVASQLPPSGHISWKSPNVTVSMLDGIVGLETNRGITAYNNTQAGVVTLQAEATAGYSFESDVNTLNVVDNTQGLASRSRMAIYIAKSWGATTRPSIDGPNVPIAQQPLIDALDGFLGNLLANAKTDPYNLPFIVGYDISDPSVYNTNDTLDAGEYIIAADVETDPGMQKLFLSLNIGENVTPTLTIRDNP